MVLFASRFAYRQAYEGLLHNSRSVNLGMTMYQQRHEAVRAQELPGILPVRFASSLKLFLPSAQCHEAFFNLRVVVLGMKPNLGLDCVQKITLHSYFPLLGCNCMINPAYAASLIACKPYASFHDPVIRLCPLNLVVAQSSAMKISTRSIG